jgi:hypothetical protein
MTSQDFLKKWLREQAPSRRDEFVAEVMELLKAPDSKIWVESTVSHRDMRGLVTVKMGPYSFQLDPQEARKIGTDFLDVAHACELDAYCYQFFGQEMDVPLEQVGMMVAHFREWRERTKQLQRRPEGPKQ